jgi:hypothetical protein
MGSTVEKEGSDPSIQFGQTGLCAAVQNADVFG